MSQFLVPERIRASLDNLQRLHPVSPLLDAFLSQARTGAFVSAPDAATRSPADVAMVSFVGGLDALQSGKIALAQTLLRFVQRVAPDFSDVSFWLGAAYALNREDQKAIETWQTTRETSSRVMVYPVLIDALVRRGEFNEALTAAASAVTAKPDDVAMLFLALQLLYQKSAEAGLSESDAARFTDWAARYERNGGDRVGLVRAWRRAIGVPAR